MAQTLKLVYAISELLSNIGFETAGAGGADVFGSWTESAGDGAIARTLVAGEFRSGVAACKLTAGATANTYVYQAITVTPGLTYRLLFWTRGDGTNAGRYRIHDATHTVNIVGLTSTGITAAVYALYEVAFTAPAGCVSVQILLYCPLTNAGIAYFDDLTVAQVELSLMSGHAGFDAQAENRGWAGPRVAASTPGRIPPDVVESLPLQLERSSLDLAAASLQALHDMQEHARRYQQDRQEQYPVWLWHQHASETSGRRVLVKEIIVDLGEAGAALHKSPEKPYVYRLNMNLRRHPYWESTTATDLGDTAGTAGITIVHDYTAGGGTDIVGDVPGRLDYMYFRGTGTGNTKRIWCGFRGTKYGAPTNFVQTWECESGTNNAAESGVVDRADATASGGNAVRVTETDLNWDNEWQQVLYVQLSQMTSNYQEQYGLCLHLLRAKVSAGTWQLQLRHGNMKIGAAYAVRDDIVDVSSTSWNFYEMGVFAFPTRYLHALTLDNFDGSYDQYDGFYVFARRTSGAGTMDVDCVVRIPMTEGIANLKAQDHELSSNLYKTYIGCAPEDRFHVQGVYGSGFTEVIPPVTPNFYPPVGDGRLIICLARAASSDIADELEIDGGRYYPRWLSLRGAE